MKRYLLLGTAGHIDHGKTSLIQALTGTNADRLPEEKRRGITIDLGFASLDLGELHLGIVDVPGHERFVKNMLAGAMGIDLALLVVAANEGVMPQTREHFEALSYLGLSAGVIALTKSDLAEPDWIELIEEDIRELVVDSFLETAKIVCVSTHTGAGLDQLRTQLAEAAQQVPSSTSDAPFRLSIDRCFSLPGHGAIVTGSVASGRVEVGEKLQLLPSDAIVQVRGLQSHGQQQLSIERGQRAAINLTGIHYRDLHRGDLLSTPNLLKPSRLLTVQLQTSRFRSRPLQTNAGIRFYTGTVENVGRLRLLESPTLTAGESQVAQIELEKPVSAVWGEAFVARGLTLNEVLGGGRIIDPRARRVTPKLTRSIDWIKSLAATDPKKRLAAFAALSGTQPWTPQNLYQRIGVADSESLLTELTNDGELCRFDCRTTTHWLHKEIVNRLEQRLLEALHNQHRAEPLLAQIPLGRLQRSFTHLEPADLLFQIAARMSADNRLTLAGDFVAAKDWQPTLSAKQIEVLESIIATCNDSGLTPPTLTEFATTHNLPIDEIESLLQVATQTGQLIRLPDKETQNAKAAQRARIYLHAHTIANLLERLNSAFSNSAPWTVSQFGEELAVSRKYAIPLCQYLDQNGITTREGNLRTLSTKKSPSSS